MAEDIKMIWDEEIMEGDLDYFGGDLIRESGLETAVLMSLFTDQRVDDENLLDDLNDKRGWWGDKVTTEYPDDAIGSRLWLLERQKITQQVVNLVKIYIQEALEWMIEDGVASEIKVTTEVIYRNSIKDTIAAQIQIYKDGVDRPLLNIKFNDVWDAQFNMIT